MKNLGICIALCMLSFVVVGCRKPYHEKMLVDVGTSEIAVLVETINDNGQAVVAPPTKVEKTKDGKVKASGKNLDVNGEAVDFYKKRVVNARTVEIPYYWKQTHRIKTFSWEHAGNGEWRPAARLIVVDTAPVTREWASDLNKGSSAKDEAIWAESKDSVGFSTGISITARIANTTDAIRFLANYPPQQNRESVTEGGAPFKVEVASLEDVMDQEVRTKVQEIFAYEAAAHDMDLLREEKRQIMDTVRDGKTWTDVDSEEERTLEGVVDFFKRRGITITTIGQFGGFTYENKQIQLAIDKVFEAQQDEEVAKAESKAAEQRKVALKLKGEGLAEQAIEAARGKAEGVKLEAEAEAEAIELVADAKAYELTKLSENPEAYLTLKSLEIEMKRLEAWDGKYPSYLIQGGGGGGLGVPNLLLTTPQPAALKTK